ncbi:MAG: alpha-mannosidase [Candidatus Marinimicrobia bacterium]|nr:alpha-mannosidase [Candidatus Neomarinimicrobiota bacterium]
MYPPSPFAQTLPHRLVALRRRVEDQVWGPPQPVAVAGAPPAANHCTAREAACLTYAPVSEQDAPWGRMFDQRWYRIELPPVAERAGWYLHWPDNGETTAWWQGVPYIGLDLFHPWCALPAGGDEPLYLESMCSGFGLFPASPRLTPQGQLFTAPSLRRRNDTAWHTWHDLLVFEEILRHEYSRTLPPETFAQLMTPLPPPWNMTPLYRQLVERLARACDAHDREGFEALRAALARIFEAFPAPPYALQACLTGHAHLDLVWLWPEKATRFKAVHTAASVLRLGEQYPEFRFGFSQSAAYRMIANRAPELHAEIRQRIAAGQWEATGATEVEMDTQLACGEALARAFLVGQAYFQELRGTPARCLWLPDVFGYSACLPQIMTQCGVEFFFTSKLTWSQLNRFPLTSFVWRGHDGSEVLAHLASTGYNGQVTLKELHEAAGAHRQAGVHPEALMPTGHGDGGGGPTPLHCERALRFANWANAPRTRWDRIEDFFDRLDARRGDLPTYQGELYLEYHRGVQTTHGHLKLAFRRAERALQAWEAAHCLAAAGPIAPAAWQRLVFAQFHDYIPGSSIHEVYAEALPELAALARQGAAAAQQALQVPDGAESIFNPLPYERPVTLANKTVRLPALVAGPVAEAPAWPIRQAPAATPTTLENDRVRAEFDSAGRIRALMFDGRPVAQADPLGELWVFADHPHAFEAWDIDRDALALGTPVPPAAAAPDVVHAPDRAEVAFTRAFGAASRITVRYRLEPGEGVLRIGYDLDLRDQEVLLKAVFPTRYAGIARYGAPFGSVVRDQSPGRELAEAQWEVPASRWAAVADEGETEGLAVITEAKYGFGARSGALHVSLARSAYVTNARLQTGIRTADLSQTHSDLGSARIEIALAPYGGARPREESPAALADLLYTPPIPYRGPAYNAGLLGLHGAPSVAAAWAQPLGPGAWILRLNETLGRRGLLELELEPGWQADIVDLSGRPLPGIRQPDGRLAITPYALIGVRLSARPRPVQEGDDCA